MDYLLVIFATLAIATVVLSVGIVMTRSPQQNLRSVFGESLGWGAGLFLSYSAAILVFEFSLVAG